MLGCKVSGYKATCSAFVGGTSQLFVGDANDFDFTEGAVDSNGDPTGYSAVARRAGASGPALPAVAATCNLTVTGIGTDAVAETLSTATYTITAIGSNGDGINLVVGGSTSLTGGAVTKTSTESSVTLLAAKIVDAINGGSHGYTAANTAGVITITGPVNSGSAINGSVITDVLTGGITGTKTSFDGGVAAVAASSIIVLSGTTALSGTVLKTSTEADETDLAAKIALSINGLTGTTGYSATSAGAVITVIAPAGATPNGVTLTRTIVGGITTTATAFSGGAAANPGGAYLFEITSIQDTIEVTIGQSNGEGTSSEYAYEIKARTAQLCQAMTNFTKKLDAASICCQLIFVWINNDGKIFVAGEKYVNGLQIIRFKFRQDGSKFGGGKVFKDFNGGDLSFKANYLRNPYEFIGGVGALNPMIAA